MTGARSIASLVALSLLLACAQATLAARRAPAAEAATRKAAAADIAAAEAAATQAAADALRATLDRHLDAIRARDLDGLLATVTRGETLTTILPNGTVLDTRQAYRDLHVAWFAQDDWRMVFDVREVRLLGETGIALVRYDSQARNAGGGYDSRRIALLTLVFAREDGAWRLVYDQNTVVPPAAP